MSEHKTPWTPGPYRVDWVRGLILSPEVKVIAFIPASLLSHPEARPTADLLAEAPAMAELLKRARLWLTTEAAEADQLHDEIGVLLARIGAP